MMRNFESALLLAGLLVLGSPCLPEVHSQDGIIHVVGKGTADKPPYRGGGTVEFLDMSLGAQVVHCDAANRFRLPLEIRYRVQSAAPILLTTRLGTEYWRIYDYANATAGAMYTDEAIDLRTGGEHTARTEFARFGTGYGARPHRGLVGILGRSYFLVDQPNRDWLDVVSPPPFFDDQSLAKKLTFTLAKLDHYDLSVENVKSTWRSNGPLRVQFTVVDSDQRRLPIVNVPASAQYDGGKIPLRTEWTAYGEPTGWTVGTLPSEVPDTVTVAGDITLQTAGGIVRRRVTRAIRRGTGQVATSVLAAQSHGYDLPRSAAGAVRETRAIWVGTRALESAAAIDQLVADCLAARLNVIVPDVFVRNTLLVHTPLMPRTGLLNTPDFDPLAYLIEKAHAHRIEVHPWFCVTYRDQAFRDWFAKQHKTRISIIDEAGKPVALGADVHRAEYREFISKLMISVARNYAVDGIHLDYIRAMHHCYCPRCRSEFKRLFGKPMTAAVEADWIKWHRQAIADIVQRTATGVRQVRPRAIMSAAVFANMPGGAIQGQDPAQWTRQGWIDVVMPMDYQMQTLAVRANERQFLAALDQDDQLVTGLSLYQRSGSDVRSRPAKLLQAQIDLVRHLGTHGYCLFAYTHLSSEQSRVLREYVNQEVAIPYFRAASSNHRADAQDK